MNIMLKIMVISAIICLIPSTVCHSQTEKLNVLGIQVGDDKDAAMVNIRSIYPGTTFQDYTQEVRIGSYVSPAFTLGVTGSNKETQTQSSLNGELNDITLFFDQCNANQIIALKRTVKFRSDQNPTYDAILGALKSKFGEPTYQYVRSSNFNVNKQTHINYSKYAWTVNSSLAARNDQGAVDFLSDSSTNLLNLLNLRNYPYLNVGNSKRGQYLLCILHHGLHNDQLIHEIEFTLDDTDRVRSSIIYLRDLLLDGETKQKKKDEEKGADVKVNF